MKKQPSASTAEAPPRARRAKLDHDGVYWGAEEVQTLAPGDLEVPDEYIRPGAYRWDAKQGCWVPLPPHQVKHVEAGPTLEQAFFDLTEMVMAMDPSFPVPARVEAWRAWFENTADEKGKK